jgi:hypothetical protein
MADKNMIMGHVINVTGMIGVSAGTVLGIQDGLSRNCGASAEQTGDALIPRKGALAKTV